MKETLNKQIEKLNMSEKLLLVEALWDSIVSSPRTSQHKDLFWLSD